MKNYKYSPEELKIIVDIANKNHIPISLDNDSITIHSKRDFTPLLKFSINGMKVFSNISPYLSEIKSDCESLMCGVAIKS